MEQDLFNIHLYNCSLLTASFLWKCNKAQNICMIWCLYVLVESDPVSEMELNWMVVINADARPSVSFDWLFVLMFVLEVAFDWLFVLTLSWRWHLIGCLYCPCPGGGIWLAVCTDLVLEVAFDWLFVLMFVLEVAFDWLFVLTLS